jgi:hypothetical protein
MLTQEQIKLPTLTINQRNIYMYFLNHRKKYKTAPCFVPKCPTQNGIQIYLNALIKLEQYGLMRVDRNSDNYTGWIMLEPKAN